MRKKFLFAVFVLLIMFGFCSCTPKTYADELDETTTEEETVSFQDQLKDWIEKFLPSILSGVAGAPTMLFIYLFFRKRIKKMAEDVVNSTILTNDEKKKSLDILNKANEMLDKKVEDLTKHVENVEEIEKKAQERFEEQEKVINDLLTKSRVNQEMVTKLFSILAILVSQNPNLCNEGYAKQLLELMDTKKEGE